MNWSESRTAIAEALAKFNEEATNPVKDKTAEIRSQTGTYTYGFSDLAALTNLVRPILAKNGISPLQEMVSETNRIGARTVLLHTSGEFIEFEPVFITHSQRPQEIGSAATYARRYALLAALSIAADDDDGAAAQRGFDPAPAEDHAEQPAPKVHPSVVYKIRELKDQLKVDQDTYYKQLEHYGVSVDTDLTTQQAVELKRAYEDRIKAGDAQ